MKKARHPKPRDAAPRCHDEKNRSGLHSDYRCSGQMTTPLARMLANIFAITSGVRRAANSSSASSSSTSKKSSASASSSSRSRPVPNSVRSQRPEDARGAGTVSCPPCERRATPSWPELTTCLGGARLRPGRSERHVQGAGALEALTKPRFAQEGAAAFPGNLPVSCRIEHVFHAREGAKGADFPRKNFIPIR